MKLTEYKHIYIIGNGGSYANAVHIANDLQMVGLKAYTLDAASLTASANDYGYETVFERWIEVVGEKGDLLIALSGSGRSPNILRALTVANQKGMETMAIFGAYNQHEGVAKIMLTGGMTMQEAEQHQIAWGHEQMLRLRK